MSLLEIRQMDTPAPEGAPAGTAQPEGAEPAGRDRTIDIMRGLLIAIVVAGHANPPFNNLLTSFQMTAWFILSGTLHRERSGRELFVSRFAALIVPYVLANLAAFGLIFALNYQHLNFWLIKSNSGYKMSQLNQLVENFAPVSGMLGDAWFLPVLFGATLLAAGLLGLQRRLGLSDGVLLLGSCGLMFLARALGPLRYYADLMVFGQFFYIAGRLVRTGRPRPDAPKTAILALTAVLILSFQHFFYNRSFNIVGRSYHSISLLVLFTFSGCYLVYLAARAVARMGWVGRAAAYTGRKSLEVLLLHFLGFRIFVLILVLVFHKPESFFNGTGPAPNRADFPHWYLTALFGLVFALAAGRAIEPVWRAALARLAGPDATIKSLVHGFIFKKPVA